MLSELPHVLTYEEFDEQLTNKLKLRYIEQTDSCQKGKGGDGMKDDEGINQRTFMHSPWSWRTVWGLAWGAERGGVGEGREGKKNGNNCNSLNNTIFFKLNFYGFKKSH